MPSMQTSDVTQERLQRLAGLEAPEGHRVLSLYLNLNPQEIDTTQARRTAVTSLMDEAERRVEGEEDLGHDAHMALRDDVRRTREFLDGGERDGWAEGAHALGIFVCGPLDLFDVVRLPRPTDSRVTIADRPAIEPLAEVGTAKKWAVLLLDGDDARLLEGTGERLEEAQALSGDHSGRSRMGGMSSQRYERSVGQEEMAFLREAIELLERYDRVRKYERILVGTTERMYGQLSGLFSQQLGERVIGRFDTDADYESPQKVRERVEPLLQQDETHREREALDARPNTRGLVDTLPALYERRVGTLLLEPGLEHPGAVCPQCRWAVAEEGGACPVDSTPMEPHPNLVEWAVEFAVEGDAEVLVLRHHNDLADSDGIGAALRF
jgi:peptide subunit release factor 1 (eRF1)